MDQHTINVPGGGAATGTAFVLIYDHAPRTILHEVRGERIWEYGQAFYPASLARTGF